ncbi:MAG TPA: DUF885 domain-containing protein [Candidatus Limnocylindrales bacterium]
MERMTDSAALDALASEYWQAYLEANPLNATYIGDVRFDDQLATHTPEGTRATSARFDGLLARANAIDAERLDTEDQVTLSALQGSIAADLAELRTGLLEWGVSPLEGAPVEFLSLPAYQRLESPEDGERMLSRWREMARYSREQLSTLRRSLADGRVASASPVRRTVAVMSELLDSPVDAWPLLEPLATLPTLDGWSEAQRTAFTDSLTAIVRDEIRPAFVALHDALVAEVLPVARSDDEPGMCVVPGGAEGYRNLIRMHTSVDIDAETLHRIGHAEIARIDAEMLELAGRTIGTSTLADALAALRAQPSLYFGSREEVFEKAASSLRRANEVAPAWFGRLPAAACTILEMPPHEEDHSGAAYYRAPAADGSRPGVYVINTSRPAERPCYEAEALAYHEAVPGHHLQAALGQEVAGLPEFRRHLGPTAYFEGWGLYAERLADEMGLYTGDVDRIGMVSFDSWRATRLVVDTGIHAMGWSRQQAIDFMLAHSALTPRAVADEVDRYIALPGQALAYKTGQLELMHMRHDAQRRLGSAFDIRGFHDAILSDGALPLPTLARLVDRWAAGVATQARPMPVPAALS